MIEHIQPTHTIEGGISLPGDKSISHRYAMLAAIAEGESRFRNYSTGADCQSTLGCLESLGVKVRREEEEVVIAGAGLHGLRAASSELDAGNSGSTIRMLSGILAAQPFPTRIGGDESLSRRPMERIIRPLTEMGARVEAREGRFPPLTIHGADLQPIDYTLRVPSAQVKSAVLLAGLFAQGTTIVRESVRTRDHTELALTELGADLSSRRGVIELHGPAHLTGRSLVVPGDLSSAAFFLVAALMARESNLVLAGVGLNPTRAALLDFLASIGAQIRFLNIQQVSGELIGDLAIKTSKIQGGVIEGALTAAVIDEIPVLAILGTASQDGLTVKDARELRVKESDRIQSVAENLGRMGVEVEVFEDGFRVPGRQKLRAAKIDSFGDHRIAMAFAVAGLSADGETSIENAEAASVSYPAFYSSLRQVAGQAAPVAEV